MMWRYMWWRKRFNDAYNSGDFDDDGRGGDGFHGVHIGSSIDEVLAEFCIGGVDSKDKDADYVVFVF